MDESIEDGVGEGWVLELRVPELERQLACHRRAFEHFGGVPERIIIDNPECANTPTSITDPVVQRAYAQCAEGCKHPPSRPAAS